ncbi:hypothetical protein [Xanthomonas arboricola]|uniref:Lipoprotein n=1 Tax=Xanthomonas arboricola TaxID=56448 RepID=A0AB73H2V9_9XANT|nr:hypothetical protein [Xanthomonas arboricola]MBB5672475.1 hypothetical protein [Xanthomonas arboricola]
MNITMSLPRAAALALALSVAVTACKQEPQAPAAPVVEVSSKAGSITGLSYQSDVITALRAAMKASDVSGRIGDDQQAVALVDKWLPVPHDARWVDTQPPPVRSLYLDAARMQELGYSISAEIFARNANALAGKDVTTVGQAMESAYGDMYAPSKQESSDAGDAQFDADLQRFWDQRQAIAKVLQQVAPEYRPLAEAGALGRLYRDPVATKAANGLSDRLSVVDQERYQQALQLAAALAPAPDGDEQ